MPRFFLRRPQNRRGMHRSHDERRQRRFHKLAAMLRHPKITAKQSLRSSSSQADNYLRLQHGYLGIQPRPASIDFRCIRLLVDAPLAARLPLEMFHCVGDISLAAIDAGFFQSRVQQIPAGPTKGLPSRSSWFPGCSPTNMILGCAAPPPNTVCVPVRQRSQALQFLAASRNDSSVGFVGINGRGLSTRLATAFRCLQVL